jgi:hypothetical protein
MPLPGDPPAQTSAPDSGDAPSRSAARPPRARERRTRHALARSRTPGDGVARGRAAGDDAITRRVATKLRAIAAACTDGV